MSRRRYLTKLACYYDMEMKIVGTKLTYQTFRSDEWTAIGCFRTIEYIPVSKLRKKKKKKKKKKKTLEGGIEQGPIMMRPTYRYTIPVKLIKVPFGKCCNWLLCKFLENKLHIYFTGMAQWWEH